MLGGDASLLGCQALTAVRMQSCQQDLKHHNVETCFCCPQTFLTLDLAPSSVEMTSLNQNRRSKIKKSLNIILISDSHHKQAVTSTVDTHGRSKQPDSLALMFVI